MKRCMSTKTWAESVEALRYTQEQTKKQNMLDRSRLLSQCADADYRPILAIHHKLRQENIHIYDELATDKFFSIRMIGVENSQRGMGVATELIRRSILLAGCMGFQGIKTEATG